MVKRMKVSKIAEIFNGNLYNFKEDKEIKGVASLFSAKEGDISFISDKKLYDLVRKTKATAIFVNEPIKDTGVIQIIVDNPQVAFYKLINIQIHQQQ